MSGPLGRIVKAVSDEVVARLAAANYPPLVDEKILVGRAEQYTASAPPRIIFVPMGSAIRTKDIGGARTAAPASVAERRAQVAQRAIASEEFQFEVRCWGVGTSNSDNAQEKVLDDFDVTRALYHAVRQAVHAVAPGAYDIEAIGKFTDATFASSQLVRMGREYTFSLTFFTPVLGDLLTYASANVQPKPKTTLQNPTGAPATGCGGD